MVTIEKGDYSYDNEFKYGDDHANIMIILMMNW